MGLTFLNVGFLFAALAALVPLIIHLISRRRLETVDWSSLRFFKELERKRIRRVRLRERLLLLIRSLIILAVALALARPTLSGTVLGGGGHAKTSIAIVLDNSASMSRSVEGGDLMGEAKDVAGGIADLLDEGDQAFLVLAGDPPSDRRPGGTFSRDALIDEIGSVEVGGGATDYVGAVDLGAELLGGARNLNRELYLIGDMQRTGWGAGDARAEVGEPVRVYVVPTEGPENNLAVASVSVARRYGGTSGLLAITAEVVNHGRRPAEPPVRLFVEDVQVGQAGVKVEPGETATARFATSLDESEWHEGWVEIPGDVLSIDNRRYFVVPPVRRAEVLIVRPVPGDEVDEAYYLERALDPTGTGERFLPSVIPAADLGDQEHGRFPVVVLADVGRLDAAAEQWLEHHLADGGGVLIVLGGRTDIRYWNHEGFPLASRVVLREPVDRERGLRLAPAGTGHPLLEGLTVGDRLIDDVSVRRAFAAEVVDGEEVLELPGIGPALAFFGSRSGEIAVLFTGIDPAWNGLPRSGLLVPLLHRVVERLGASGVRATQVTVGDDLVVPVGGPSPGVVETTLPDGSVVAPEIQAGLRPTAVLAHAPIPGIYRFSDGRGGASLGAVNVATSESALAPASRDAIAERFAAQAPWFIEPGHELADEILEARRGRELWRVFVYAALALLALEMFLARPRFA